MFNSIARFVEQSLDDLEAQGRPSRPVYNTDNSSRPSSDYGLSRSLNGALSSPSTPTSTTNGAANAARRIAIPPSSSSTTDNGPISPPAGFGSLGGAAAWFGPSSPSGMSSQTPAKASSSSRPATARTSSDANAQAPTAQQGSSSRPSSSAGIGFGSMSNTDASKRTSNDGFPTFPGLSNLKRSLSGIPLGSLDLTSLRNSLDMNMPVPGNSSNLASPITPSRDSSDNFSIPFPNLGSPGSLLNANKQFAASIARNISQGLNGTPSPKVQRRHSARAASMSGVSGFDSLTGPFSPHTMHQQDPFFFASLQGLPDELKTAAFTPLPKEDEDEELDQIHAEVTGAKTDASARAGKQTGLGIGLPQNKLKALHIRSLSTGNRPTSAPPGSSFSIPTQRTATPPLMMRSPLAEATPSLLQHVLQEVDEPPSNAPSTNNTPRVAEKEFDTPQAESAPSILMPHAAALEAADDATSPSEQPFGYSAPQDAADVAPSRTKAVDAGPEQPPHNDFTSTQGGDIDVNRVDTPADAQTAPKTLADTLAHQIDADVAERQVDETAPTSTDPKVSASTAKSPDTATSEATLSSESKSASSASKAADVPLVAEQATGPHTVSVAPKVALAASEPPQDPLSHPLEVPGSRPPSRSVSPVPSARQEAVTTPNPITPAVVAPAPRKGGSLADRLARAARAPSPLPRKSADEDRPSPALLAEEKSVASVRAAASECVHFLRSFD